MGWKCAACQFDNVDESLVCECCGKARKSRLVLTSPGDGTVFRTVVDTEITRTVYRRLYPGVEHQYVPRNEGEHPFSVLKAKTGEWTLQANPMSPIRTVLNTMVCEGGRPYGLKPGDVISIAPPSGAERRFAPLTVSFLPVG